MDKLFLTFVLFLSLALCISAQFETAINNQEEGPTYNTTTVGGEVIRMVPAVTKNVKQQGPYFYIIGMNNLCLQGHNPGSRVWLNECSRNNPFQFWGIYQDETIRQAIAKNTCLFPSLRNVSGLPVTVELCKRPGQLVAHYQRWRFQADGTILNPTHTRVMDVRNSNPALRQIILMPRTDLVFAADKASDDSYRDFMNALRDALQPTIHAPTGIKVLQDPSILAVNRRYFEVEITTSAESITLGIDRTNVYVVGYKVGKTSYFFSDAPATARSYLFKGTTQTVLGFKGSYGDLGKREDIYLGFSELQAAVSVISKSSNTFDHRKSLVAIIQMVSEAARYHTIEYFIKVTIIPTGGYNKIKPSATMLDLENAWGEISKRVQEANAAGVMQPAVTITDREGVRKSVTSVSKFINQIAVMLYVCNPPSNTELMPIPAMNNGTSNYLRMVTTLKVTTCSIAEPIVNIIGRDGMCVDIKDGKTDDGTPLQLRPCSKQRSQIWTLKKDKTIQSLGKCMTTKGLNPGQELQIFNCKTATNDAKLWKISLEGTIASVNKPTIVLSAEGSGREITLTVRQNTYTTYQGWQADTDVQPFVVSIIGYGDLCLQASGSSVLVGKCAASQKIQRWAIYGDGSIRDYIDRTLCLNSNGHIAGSLVALVKCGGSADQRWVLNADGTIRNRISNLPMEVRNSNPALNQIILARPTSKRNQKWLVLF